MPRFESASDEQLITEQRAGHAGPAFGAFYDRHEAGVLGYFVNRVRNGDVAADLTAETFAQALRSRHRFRPRGEGSSVAWLYGIAHNVLRASVRRGVVDEQARAALSLPPVQLDNESSDVIERLGGAEQIRAALGHLPESQREAVLAHVVREQGYAEMAAELRCSEAVVRKRVSRGLNTLRANIQETP